MYRRLISTSSTPVSSQAVAGPSPVACFPAERSPWSVAAPRAACRAWKTSHAHRRMTGPSRPRSSVLVSYSTRWQVWYGWANSVTKRPLGAPTHGGRMRAMHRATRPRIIPPATTRRTGKADERLTPCGGPDGLVSSSQHMLWAGNPEIC